MAEVVLYTDGSVRTNPGIGGWAAVLCYGEHRREISGGAGRTTNNRMELAAVIEGLRVLTRPCRVHIVSDSEYIVGGINLWLPRWHQEQYTEVPSRKIMNRELWNEIFQLSKRHRLSAEWTRGHAKEDNLNNRAHDLAKATAIQYEQDPTAVHISDIPYEAVPVTKSTLSLALQ